MLGEGEAMQEPIRVSIVLATNRNSPYLAEALQSVRDQTYPHWDLLVVDNGVPDTAQLTDAVGDDPRMSVIRVDATATAGRARNIGVARTEGALVTILDDDDVWRTDRLQLHVEVHREHPEAPASFSGYWHMDAAGHPFGVDWRSRQTDSAEMLRGGAETPLGPTLVIRRSAYNAIGGFSPEIPILVDFELALRLAMLGDLRYLDATLVGYRRHDANMTSTAPANARLRRTAMQMMLDRQVWAAQGRGDTTVARLLGERRRRFELAQARQCGEEMMRAARGGRIRDAAGDAAWALRRAPSAFLAHAVRFALSRLLRTGAA
ncbi:glycosyltransferase family A protein [Microbacterium sp. Marseille-Q6648]|uniref:glycosyltransferase family 2 protein n=1 Tax=Microbacterium sp. Marseille-Q6648 TaxID=2937991 RepID=UPI00203EE2D1|nr:glycosyltransferase family A protein [Microbacterium sp. Marseille-Q6648]